MKETGKKIIYIIGLEYIFLQMDRDIQENGLIIKFNGKGKYLNINNVCWVDEFRDGN